MTKPLGVSLAIAVCVLLTEPTSATDRGSPGPCCAAQDCSGTPDCCADCGGRRPCQRKVCQVVCETKTITKYCWCVECEEFCAPLPGCGSLLAGLSGRDGSCKDGCGGDSCSDSRCGLGKRPACVVPPQCGPVRARKKLVKKEYECEVPVYKCVVRYLCPDCSSGCREADEAAPQPEPEMETIRILPPLPMPDRQVRLPSF